jgi:hypothetical protein
MRMARISSEDMPASVALRLLAWLPTNKQIASQVRACRFEFNACLPLSAPCEFFGLICSGVFAVDGPLSSPHTNTLARPVESSNIARHRWVPNGRHDWRISLNVRGGETAFCIAIPMNVGASRKIELITNAIMFLSVKSARVGAIIIWHGLCEAEREERMCRCLVEAAV